MTTISRRNRVEIDLTAVLWKLLRDTKIIKEKHNKISDDIRTSRYMLEPVRVNKIPVCVLNKSQLAKTEMMTRVVISNINDLSIIKMTLIIYNYKKKIYCRHREANLEIFLYNIHPFLMKRKLEYRIFVIEQSGKGIFIKGRLYNAVFMEMQMFGTFHCVVFHDVDLLPTDSRILYSCPNFIRHICGKVIDAYTNVFINNLSFGGVTSMTVEQFKQANGFSNLYWGWGGEDYDMFWRMRYAGFPVVRYSNKIAKLSHAK
ncbi:beta-1,4-N-acetylgalactosaminyltransferase bre-4-like [Galleria mellonella]|uniref:Beta-1,4-N-acetylgalactosaminyltransferase bre-4-like n=1 Tax=Galleria mellonella TaxID=7137 RepID=A0ABM3MI36_GALME|nr:beta-1,4-N-acetylgalactosaminyltransferase bre-4-like [Galleria mellonella]